MEYLRRLEAQIMSCGNSPMVVEVCPHCESEIEMRWSVMAMGYKAFCPVCGNRLMLCDECQHDGPDGEYTGRCDYCTETDSCKHNPPKDDSELAYLTEYVRESCFDEEISRDRLRMLWTAYCMHHGIDTGSVRYDSIIFKLWGVMQETGDGTSEWSDVGEFARFMIAYLR